MRFWFPSFIGLVSLCIATTLAGQSAKPAFEVYDSFPQLESRIREYDGSTLVINFWATWCKPCVEELPYFEKLNRQYAGSNVQVLLVSLDFKSQLESRLIPFLKENKLHSPVAVLTDQDGDSWIPRVESSWDGAIPVTLIIRGGQSAFHREKFKSYEDLETFVRPFVDPNIHTKTASRFRRR